MTNSMVLRYNNFITYELELLLYWFGIGRVFQLFGYNVIPLCTLTHTKCHII